MKTEAQQTQLQGVLNVIPGGVVIMNKENLSKEAVFLNESAKNMFKTQAVPEDKLQQANTFSL